MSHMIIYTGTDGQPGYHQADELSVAIGYVEHLRNSEGVEQAHIFKLDEVAFEFRPYYRVQIGDTVPATGTKSTSPAKSTSTQKSTATSTSTSAPDEPATPDAIDGESARTNDDDREAARALGRAGATDAKGNSDANGNSDGDGTDVESADDDADSAAKVRAAAWGGVGTDPAMPPDPAVEIESVSGGSGRRGLFGR